MNSITFNEENTFNRAVTALELSATTEYFVDEENLVISSDETDDLIDIFVEEGIDDFSVSYSDDAEYDQFRSDAEADSDALASAGFGTDEDYGYYGGGDDE